MIPKGKPLVPLGTGQVGLGSDSYLPDCNMSAACERLPEPLCHPAWPQKVATCGHLLNRGGVYANLGTPNIDSQIVGSPA